jgi:tRNA pseudouridine38-40 synthase
VEKRQSNRAADRSVQGSDGLQNYLLTIQYDGTDFHGWQVQNNTRTVQGEITSALSLLEERPCILHGAGRTDAGVHAEAQRANVHLSRATGPEKLRAAINGNIGRDVRITQIDEVAEEFHARFSAKEKTYRYVIFNAPYISPFWLRYAAHEARPLDLEVMRSVAKLFCGEHDWTAFSSAQSESKTRTRTVTGLEIGSYFCTRTKGHIVEITISATGFLRYMARSIAGTLMAAARGEISEQSVERAIRTGERELAGDTAPPQGLTLVSVRY